MLSWILFGRLTENAWQESDIEQKKGSKQVPTVQKVDSVSTGQ